MSKVSNNTLEEIRSDAQDMLADCIPDFTEVRIVIRDDRIVVINGQKKGDE